MKSVNEKTVATREPGRTLLQSNMHKSVKVAGTSQFEGAVCIIIINLHKCVGILIRRGLTTEIVNVSSEAVQAFSDISVTHTNTRFSGMW